MIEHDEQPAIEAAIAEVETEQENPDGSCTLNLHVTIVVKPATADTDAETETRSASITVPPVPQWDAEALELLEARKFTSWARLVLSDEDWRRWQNLRPNLGEADDFFGRWGELSGQGRGKSEPSRRALRRMARR